jgi:hypothetical protein
MTSRIRVTAHIAVDLSSLQLCANDIGDDGMVNC